MNNPTWSTACPDWESRIINKKSLIPFTPLFPDEAKAGLEVFNSLKVVDVIGSPTIGEISRPWVQDFMEAIFGSYNPYTGERLITEIELLISKKNSKSTIAGLLMLTLLIRNWRKSAEFLILSPTKEIADNSFKPIKDAIKADEELDAIFHIQEHIRTITHRNTGAQLKVVAADSDTVGGKKAVVILIDELWLFGKKANAESMFREATGGLASFPEGMVIYLTTQSDEPPAGVFKKRLNYARNVRDGKIIDNKFLPVLYEFPKEFIDRGDHKKPEYFYITNPNIGASVSPEHLERELNKAIEDGQDTLNEFFAKHLNVEIGLNLRSDRWAGADFWLQQEDGTITLKEIIKRSEVVEVGLDGGGLDDLLGMNVLGRDKNTKQWLSWSRAWAHEIVLERRKSEASKLRDFEKCGNLTIVERVGEDTFEAAEIILEIYKANLLDKIGVDPAEMGSILEKIVDAGIPQDLIIGISQGWRLGGAIKTAERKLAEGMLVHAKQPLMNWCVGNAKVEPKGNAILITKQASGRAKIDPLMALFNTVSLMSTNPEPKTKEYKIHFI